MDMFIKAAACGIAALILGTILPSDRKEVKMMLSIVACCAIAAVALAYLQPVLELVDHVKNIGNLNDEMIEILWKCVGVGIVSEISGMICKDMGNGTLEKMMYFAGRSAILWLTIPLFQEFMKLIEDVLSRL